MIPGLEADIQAAVDEKIDLQIEKFDLCENEEIIEKYIIKLANTIKVFFEVAGSV